jgi:hypothetical protein
MINPEKWAEKMDNELRQAEESDAAKGQVFLAKRKLLDSHAPLLWEQLTRSLAELANAFNRRRNAALTIDDGGGTFCVRRSDDAGAAVLTAAFRRLENVITIHILPSNWFRSYAAKVIPGSGEGMVCLVLKDPENNTSNQQDIDTIATDAMEELLRSRP